MSGGEKNVSYKKWRKKYSLSNVKYFGTWDEICVIKIL